MRQLMIVAIGFLGLSVGTAAYSSDLETRAVLGGGLGGALGGLIGADVGGRDGAVVGSALGAAVGTVVATDGHRRHGRVVYREVHPVAVERTYLYVDDVYVDDYRPRGHHHYHKHHKHHYGHDRYRRHHDRHYHHHEHH